MPPWVVVGPVTTRRHSAEARRARGVTPTHWLKEFIFRVAAFVPPGCHRASRAGRETSAILAAMGAGAAARAAVVRGCRTTSTSKSSDGIVGGVNRACCAASAWRSSRQHRALGLDWARGRRQGADESMSPAIRSVKIRRVHDTRGARPATSVRHRHDRRRGRGVAVTAGEAGGGAREKYLRARSRASARAAAGRNRGRDRRVST